jgi:hypothetical protein
MKVVRGLTLLADVYPNRKMARAFGTRRQSLLFFIYAGVEVERGSKGRCWLESCFGILFWPLTGQFGLARCHFLTADITYCTVIG